MLGGQVMERGQALLGYVPVGDVGMILLATRLRVAAVLPGGHQVRLVAESKWLHIPLQVPLNFQLFPRRHVHLAVCLGSFEYTSFPILSSPPSSYHLEVQTAIPER